MIHGTSTELIFGEEPENENGIYGDEVNAEDDLDMQDMHEAQNDERYVKQMLEESEQRPMRLSDYYKLQSQQHSENV